MPLDIRSKFVIAAETTGQSSIDNLSRSVGNVEQGVSRLPSVVKSAATAFAGFAVAGVTALAAATKGAIDYASAIVDAAEQTGLGVEAFQSLRFAAGQAGISAEEFVSAMQRFNTTIGAAANGSKAQADLFARLGVAIRDVNGDVRSGETVLADFADAIARIDNPAQQARTSAEAFGRAAGPKLAVLLRDGSDGLATLQQRAQDAGAVLSEKTVRAAEEAGDKLQSLSDVLKTQLAAALLELIPVLTTAGEKLVEISAGVADYFSQFNPESTRRVSSEIIQLAEHIDRVDSLIKGSAGNLEQRNKLLEAQVTNLQKLNDLYAQLRASVGAGGGGNAAPGGSQPAAGVVGETAAEIAARKAAAAAAARAAKAAQRDSTDFAGADAIRSADADAEYYRDLQQAVDGFIQSAEQELPGLLNDVTASVQETSDATVDAYLEAFEAMEDIADAAAANIADIFTDGVFAFIDDGVDGMVESFSRALKQIAADIINSQIREALRSVFTDALGQGGGGGGGGYGDLFAAVIGAFAGGSAKTGSASVAKNASGGSFIVPGPNSGDRVIPIFRANGGERVDITPAGKQGPGGNGVQIVNNIDARGADPATEARIRAEIRASEQRTVAQVAQLAKRGRL